MSYKSVYTGKEIDASIALTNILDASVQQLRTLANQHEASINTINNTLRNKTDNDKFLQLNVTVENKANITDIERIDEVLTNKTDKNYVDENLLLKADLLEITKLNTALTYKADKTELQDKIDAVNNRINNLSTVDLEDRISSQEEFTTAISQSMVDQFETINTSINNIDEQITTINGNIENASILIAQKVDTTTFDSQVNNITNLVDQKANVSEVNVISDTVEMQSGDISFLKSEISNIKSSLDSTLTPSDLESLQQSITSLQQKLNQLENRIKQLEEVNTEE